MDSKILAFLTIFWATQIFSFVSTLATDFPNHGHLPPALNASFNEMDDFAEVLTLFNTTDPILKIRNPKIKNCYKKQKESYENILLEFKKDILKFGEKFNETLEITEEIIQNRTQRNLDKIIFAVTSHPQIIWNFIKNLKLIEASSALFDYKNQVQFVDVKVFAQIKKLEAKKPEVAKNSKTQYKEIREKAKNECIIIAEKIKNCINGDELVKN